MRLTLRTLLAYLDDILEPNQAKEIGHKVAESGFATTLVNRIREVMRRRRLASPDLEGPGSGLDPNLVAEYLDNTLPPEGVADIEKVCLDSDVHLAEVAACHQILTLVLGEPVEIRPATRERMYSVGPISSVGGSSDAASGGQEQAATPVDGRQPAVKASQVGSTAVPESSTAAAVPEYLKPKPLLRRVVPYALLAAIAALWLGSVFYDPDLAFFARQRTSEQVAQIPPAGEGDLARNHVAQAVENGAVGDVEEAAPADAVQTEPDAAATGVAPDTGDAEDVTAEPSPPTVAQGSGPSGDDSSTAAPPASGRVSGDVVPESEASPLDAVIVEHEEVQPPPAPGEIKPDATPSQPDIAAGEPPTLQYNSLDGLLLVFSPEVSDWVVVPRRSLIHPGEHIAVPEPYDAQFDAAKGQSRITLVAGTSVRRLGPTATAPLGFQISRGRMLIEAQPLRATAPKQDGPVVLAIGAAHELWRLELTTPGTLCGIEIRPLQPEGFKRLPDPNAFVGGLYVLNGSVVFADADGQKQVIDGPASMPLTPGQPRIPTAQPPEAAALFPAWLTPDSRQMSAIARRWALQFEGEIEKNDPISLSVPAITGDSRPRIAELACKLLDLTGHYRTLVRALARSDHAETRQAAIEGLRTWLGAAPENDALLHAELEKNFHPDSVEIVYRLLWGFSNEDARDAAASQQLVGWLMHDDVAVRELAIYHLVRLTGRRYDYHANLPAAPRKAAADRWTSHVERYGGVVAK